MSQKLVACGTPPTSAAAGSSQLAASSASSRLRSSTFSLRAASLSKMCSEKTLLSLSSPQAFFSCTCTI